jgi:prepilin-type N-terminal cleavage/methylation domain-containing protein
MCKNVGKKRHASRGMTLVELLLVMVILSIVMMAVMGLFIPTTQSAAVQAQVTDVQSNLRLALKSMTRDLLLAGFLVPVNPVIFEASATPTTAENPDANDFTIRTRIVGSDFARVIKDTTDLDEVELSLAAMVDHFPDNALIRLFEPLSAEEINVDDVPNADERVYQVVGSTAPKLQISDPNGHLTAADVVAETVIVRVRDNTQPPVQNIRYRLNNDSLERIVNGSVQVLARNVDTANSGFTYGFTPEGRVNRVDIRLTGKTTEIKNDAISGEKSREIETSVNLRNIN